MDAPGVGEWVARLRDQGVAESLIEDAMAAAARMAAAADAIRLDPAEPLDPGALAGELFPSGGTPS